MLVDVATPVASQPLPKQPIFGKAHRRILQSLRIGRFDEEPVLAVRDDLGNAADPRCKDGEFASHRLEERVRPALAV